MLQPKAEMFERFEQSIELMKKNLFSLVLPLFVLNFVFFGLISLFSMKYIEKIIGNSPDFMKDGFLQALYSSEGILIIAIGMFIGLLYSIVYIPVLLASIRSIHQAAQAEKINVIDNIGFGFKNILNSFSTYWFIFKYVFMIPAILFIVGGLLFNMVYFMDISGNIGDIIKNISYVIMGTSLLLGVTLSVYRGIRATFVLYSATSNNRFTQENFDKNITITKTKAFRVWGNFFVIGMVLGFIIKIVGIITKIFLPNIYNFGLDKLFGDLSLMNIITKGKMPNLGDIQSLDFSKIEITFSTQNYIINSLVNEFIAAIFTVFIFVFTYIFMKRLELEKSGIIKNDIIDTTKLEIINTDKVEL